MHKMCKSKKSNFQILYRPNLFIRISGGVDFEGYIGMNDRDRFSRMLMYVLLSVTVLTCE